MSACHRRAGKRCACAVCLQVSCRETGRHAKSDGYLYTCKRACVHALLPPLRRLHRMTHTRQQQRMQTCCSPTPRLLLVPPASNSADATTYFGPNQNKITTWKTAIMAKECVLPVQSESTQYSNQHVTEETNHTSFMRQRIQAYHMSFNGNSAVIVTMIPMWPERFPLNMKRAWHTIYHLGNDVRTRNMPEWKFGSRYNYHGSRYRESLLASNNTSLERYIDQPYIRLSKAHHIPIAEYITSCL